MNATDYPLFQDYMKGEDSLEKIQKVASEKLEKIHPNKQALRNIIVGYQAKEGYIVSSRRQIHRCWCLPNEKSQETNKASYIILNQSTN